MVDVVFDHAEPEATDITTFYFKPRQPLAYTAGQFIELTLPHAAVDKRGHQRWFTLSSSPTEALLSITTKFAPRSSSFKTNLLSLELGTAVRMSEPMGDFVLPKLLQTPLIFVAVGIGVTPFRSMLTWLADTGEVRPIELMYGVKSEDEIIFQSVFERVGVATTIVVREPSSAWGGVRGSLSAELILGLKPLTADTLVYLSGPRLVVEDLAKDLRHAGLDRQRIVIDEFLGYD